MICHQQIPIFVNGNLCIFENVKIEKLKMTDGTGKDSQLTANF